MLVKAVFVLCAVCAVFPCIAADRRIVTLVCEESVPFNFQENSAVVGIAADIIREAFQRSGYTVVYRQYPWARALYLAKTGAVDGIFCLYRTAEREGTFCFSEMIGSDTQAFFVLRDSAISFDGDYRKLAGKSIGVINGYSYGEKFDAAVRDGTLSRVEAVSSQESNIKKLLYGRIDMLVEGEYLEYYLLGRMGKAEAVKELSVKVNKPGLYVGFTKARDLSLELMAFNAGLSLIKQDGTYNRIIRRYGMVIPVSD